MKEIELCLEIWVWPNLTWPIIMILSHTNLSTPPFTSTSTLHSKVFVMLMLHLCISTLEVRRCKYLRRREKIRVCYSVAVSSHSQKSISRCGTTPLWWLSDSETTHSRHSGTRGYTRKSRFQPGPRRRSNRWSHQITCWLLICFLGFNSGFCQ